MRIELIVIVNDSLFIKVVMLGDRVNSYLRERI